LNFLAFLWAANMVSPKPGAAGLPTAATEVKVYGLDLTDYSPRAQFIVLGGGALISALVFAFLQEKVCVCRWLSICICACHRRERGRRLFTVTARQAVSESNVLRR
jgi:hypothetical protein